MDEHHHRNWPSLLAFVFVSCKYHHPRYDSSQKWISLAFVLSWPGNKTVPDLACSTLVSFWCRNYGVWNTAPTGALGFLFCPCIESAPKVGTKHWETIARRDAFTQRQLWSLFDDMVLYWQCAGRALHGDPILKGRCLNLASIHWWTND